MYIKEIKLKFKKRKAKKPEGLKVISSRSASQALKFLNKEVQERVVVMVLSAYNIIQGIHLVHIGSLTECLQNPADILRIVLFAGCPSFVVAHNHPSGNSTPSKEDSLEYGRLSKASKLIKLKLLDYLVIGDKEYYSFTDQAKGDL